MGMTEVSVLITDDEKVTAKKDILARGVKAFEDAGEKAPKVELTGTDVFDGYKAYHFRAAS